MTLRAKTATTCFWWAFCSGYPVTGTRPRIARRGAGASTSGWLRAGGATGGHLELKFEHGADASRLQVLATEALAQIEARAYDADTARGGAGAPSTAGSLRYGIAFSGKSLAVAAERRPS